MEVDMRILLVEDDAPLRRSLEKFLERAGYTFDSCSTAREALMLAARHRHDILISEYHLPDADGAGLLEKLKPVVPELATIILSEFDFQVIADALVRVHVGSLLKKPFDLVDLEAALFSAHAKTNKDIGTVDWEPETHIEGVPAALFK